MRTLPDWAVVVLSLIAFPFIGIGLIYWTVVVGRFLSSVLPSL